MKGVALIFLLVVLCTAGFLLVSVINPGFQHVTHQPNSIYYNQPNIVFHGGEL
jgi:hypothetical protein